MILLSRFADHEGRATVATSTLCRAMRIGSKNTVEKALNLAAHEDVGILRKISGKGGNGHARKSNTYIFLGADRNWQPLPQTKPGMHHMVAISQGQPTDREAGSRPTGPECPPSTWRQRTGIRGPTSRTLEAELTPSETAPAAISLVTHASGEVTNENPSGSPGIASRSYEPRPAALSGGDDVFIGHKRVTDENGDIPPSTATPRIPTIPVRPNTPTGTGTSTIQECPMAQQTGRTRGRSTWPAAPGWRSW